MVSVYAVKLKNLLANFKTLLSLLVGLWSKQTGIQNTLFIQDTKRCELILLYYMQFLEIKVVPDELLCHKSLMWSLCQILFSEVRTSYKMQVNKQPKNNLQYCSVCLSLSLA